ncbi:uncharacterized protein LOC118802824 [Colossoma macropomum]|uniref:uncharacterized protein LOC118802824 n=1 Tax=Colossoma macropomum TaxID=42526 RepID=UPI00186539A2|nr:uncharacterized protein LOC118802824 [Colossoma macropomum]
MSPPVTGTLTPAENLLLSYWLCVSAGCTVINLGKTLPITAYIGGSVLLPCYCSDLQNKPEGFSWRKLNTKGDAWEDISSESGQYRNRVQLVNGHSPGNLSLLISHLTEEDGGEYQCYVEGRGHVYSALTVEGCTVINLGKTLPITAYIGGSVLLPCYCTDLHITPEGFTWRKLNTNGDAWEDISSESGQYRNRVQLVNGHSPGNLSLLISHLTEEDGGEYQCYVERRGHVYTRLVTKVLQGMKASLTLHLDSATVFRMSISLLLLQAQYSPRDGKAETENIDLQYRCKPEFLYLVQMSKHWFKCPTGNGAELDGCSLPVVKRTSHSVWKNIWWQQRDCRACVDECREPYFINGTFYSKTVATVALSGSSSDAESYSLMELSVLVSCWLLMILSLSCSHFFSVYLEAAS